MRSNLYLLLFLLLTSACSTPQKTRTLSMVSGLVAGGIIGSATAPSNERKELHALYWGGLVGIGAGLIANYAIDDSAQIEKLELETKALKSELQLMQNAKMVQIKEGKGQFKNSVPGHWKLYEVDRWEKESPNRLHHIDQIIEVDPGKSN